MAILKKGELVLIFNGKLRHEQGNNIVLLVENVYEGQEIALVNCGSFNTRESTKNMHKLPRSVQKIFKESQPKPNNVRDT